MPLVIPVTDTVRLSIPDPYNIVIEKGRLVQAENSPNKGKMQWDPVAYHSRLDHAFHNLLVGRAGLLSKNPEAQVSLQELSGMLEELCLDLMKAALKVQEGIDELKALEKKRLKEERDGQSQADSVG